ncbi:DNA-binding protein [Saccharopolyspora erythraea]|nr:DNA-binding protein [Saccharopolyspora erythraea]
MWGVSAIPAAPDVLAPDVEVIPLPDVAERLGQPVTRVHQLIRDGHLLAVRRDGVLGVPTVFLAGDAVVKGLGGTITLLRDNGYNADEILRWLFTADDTLPGTPIDALRGDRGREVKRRAQAMGF